ncbi:MAG: UvrD-helicase domain-containing protein, partial [Candidatus Hydrogenedentes bacterium]|nr:UvrD-helicase domain-containing protein [Candidatus Hydrogenedentota bacterium]
MDILSDLNEPQREAVMHVDGPLLVLAGAGSGKTRVITRRVAQLIERGIAPENILAITFTNKSAEEMRQRIGELNAPPGATICTFHSLCARLLREFAETAGIDRNYTIYDRNDQIKITKRAIEDCHMTGTSLVPGGVHAAISNAKNELKSPQAYAQRAGNYFQRGVAEIYRRYEVLLTDNNALDFDDLLMRMAMLLRDRSDIREYLGRGYKYVLIDEYQDTNH